MSKPLASVIIPAYRVEGFVRETLESVLRQDYPNYEVIVVDDGSDDATPKLVAEYPVQLLRQPHRGISAARNAGLRVARGDYLTILDADDLWPADRLSAQVEYLEQHPQIEIVLGLTEFFLTPGQERPPHFSALMEGDPVPGHASTMLARRQVFELVGDFDETLVVGEDIDWLARAKDAGVPSARLDQVFLHYRIHSNNISRHTARNREAIFEILRRSVHRQNELRRG